jgi:hypothetical protein
MTDANKSASAARGEPFQTHLLLPIIEKEKDSSLKVLIAK